MSLSLSEGLTSAQQQLPKTVWAVLP